MTTMLNLNMANPGLIGAPLACSLADTCVPAPTLSPFETHARCASNAANSPTTAPSVLPPTLTPLSQANAAPTATSANSTQNGVGRQPEQAKPYKLYNDAMTIQYTVPIDQIAEETVGSQNCQEHELTPVWVRQAEAALQEYPTFFVCENYVHFGTCPSGPRCPKVHIAPNNRNVQCTSVHVNRLESLKNHPTQQAGKQITVFDRATGRSQTYGTEYVLCTKGSSDWVAGYHCGRRVYHCKHFFRMSLCTRAEQCAFIHVVGTHRAGSVAQNDSNTPMKSLGGNFPQKHLTAEHFNPTSLPFLSAQNGPIPTNGASSADLTLSAASLSSAPMFPNTSSTILTHIGVPFLNNSAPSTPMNNMAGASMPQYITAPHPAYTAGYSIMPTQAAPTPMTVQSLIPLYSFPTAEVTNPNTFESATTTSLTPGQPVSSSTTSLNGFFNNAGTAGNPTMTGTATNSQGHIACTLPSGSNVCGNSSSQILYAVPMAQPSPNGASGPGMETWVMNPATAAAANNNPNNKWCIFWFPRE